MHLYPKRACLDGLEMEIFKLVSYSATPEQWEEWLRVPLEHAAAQDNLDLFNKLLGAGANGRAGWRGCRGRTLLYAAAVGGNEEVVSGLLRVGSQPDVNVELQRRSPLYAATTSGHEAVARRLVLAGADVNFEDLTDNWAVLHEAVRGGHGELAEFLLVNGANMDAQDYEEGGTPLHVAADEGFDGIVSTLLLRGADKDALDDRGSTPVMGASIRGHASVVKTLLAAGADHSIRNNTGAYSALDLAAEEGHVPVIEAIVGHGADVNARDGSGYTALHTAAEYDQEGAINALTKAGADVDLRSDEDTTPLVVASARCQRNAMLALLQHGASVDVRDSEGNTPLHAACSERCEGLRAAVDILLRWGGDETALNQQGRSPADMLHEVITVDDWCCTVDEIERTLQLLARAPAERAWRRRGWLAVLRTRASEARAASNRNNSEGSTRDSSAAAGDRSEGEDFNGCGGAVGSEGAGGVLDGILALLIEPEGVFRTVVGFL